MSNKNYTGHTESFQIDKDSNEIDLVIESDWELHPLEIKKTANPGTDSNEIVVHHTDYNSAGRRSYDYSLSGSGHQKDHETRNSDNKHNNV